jgi:hypothetical protein
LSYAEENDSYETLEVAITEQTYTAISLTPGVVYKFIVQARNAFGISDYSEEVFILAAQIPDQPQPPVTTFLRETVQIDWIEPFTGGSAITGYKIYIRESDAIEYTLELHDCDGGVETIWSNQQCTVLVSTLRNAPFSLLWGSSVYAKVLAYNLYGESTVSDEGNGAVIITYTDPAIDLTETVSARTASTITFTWSDGDANGGSPIIDYRVSYDQGTDEYVDLATSVVNKEYTATGLNYGTTYKFKVETRNEFGYSVHSEEVSILCAMHPEKPASPTTTVVTDYVIFNWDAPVDNGTPITGYEVYIR